MQRVEKKAQHHTFIRTKTTKQRQCVPKKKNKKWQGRRLENERLECRSGGEVGIGVPRMVRCEKMSMTRMTTTMRHTHSRKTARRANEKNKNKKRKENKTKGLPQ